LNVLTDIDGEVLDDEVIIIRSSGPTDEPDIFQPYSEVCLPVVLGDVSGRSEAQWEWRFLDAMTEGPLARAVWAGAPVAVLNAGSAARPVWGGPPRAHPQAGGHNPCSGSPVDIGAAAGQLP
jgi:hypothetical protein